MWPRPELKRSTIYTTPGGKSPHAEGRYCITRDLGNRPILIRPPGRANRVHAPRG